MTRRVTRKVGKGDEAKGRQREMESERTEGKKEFLPHVQGIRGLAIALIVLYHLNPAWCPCGYFGVDIFLLITGYFILRNELTAGGEKKVGDYLHRKWWRIAPAVTAVGTAVLLFAMCAMVRSRCEDVGYTLAGAILGVSNEVVAHRGNYFAMHTQENPLMHLWYVGVVVQLYVLTALLMLFGRRVRCVLAGGLGGISLLLYVALSYKESHVWLLTHTEGFAGIIYPYFSTATRMWEAVAAAAVVLLPAWESRPTARAVTALLGMVLLVVPVWCLQTASAACFYSVGGGILLIRYGTAGVVGKILRWAPVQWLGKVSFSLYLVHWPLIVLWKYLCFRELYGWEYVLLMFLSLVLGWVLWKTVETRSLRWKVGMPTCAHRVCVGVMVIALVGSVGYYVSVTEGVEWQRVPDKQLHGFPTEVFEHRPLLIGEGKKGTPTFLLLGDSHSWHLHSGMNRYCKEQEEELCGIWLNNNCVPVWNCYIRLMAGKASWTRERGEALLAWLRDNPEIDSVLISVYWHMRLTNKQIRDWEYRDIPPEQRRAYLIAGVVEYCRRLQGIGKRVIILADTPFFPGSRDPLDTYYRDPSRGLPSLTPEQWEALRRTDADFYTAVERAGIELWDITPALLSDGRYSFCPVGEEPDYRDSNHLAPKGSYKVGRFIMERLNK